MKVRKCPLENSGIYTFRLEYLLSHLKRLHGKKHDDVKELARTSIIELGGRQKVEDNNAKVRAYQKKRMMDMENNNAPLVSEKEERMEDVLQVDVTEDEQGTLDFDILDGAWMDTLLEGICGEEDKLNERENSNDDQTEEPLDEGITEEDEALDHNSTENV